MMSKIILILLFVFPVSSFASNYFCGKGNNKIVRQGDSSGVVRLQCGEPMSVNKVGIVTINGKDTNLEKWTYNPGYGKLYQIFVFQDDILVNVENGPRVTDTSQ